MEIIKEINSREFEREQKFFGIEEDLDNDALKFIFIYQ